MTSPTVSRRRRYFRILRLFFGLVLSFLLQYARARLRGRSYDFFEDAQHNRRRAVRLRNTAVEMGGVLIKVGQFLSSRVDLLPTEYIEELALLQDEVPPVPYAEIAAAVEGEFGQPVEAVFAAFDPRPVAAASLGQVHRATLHGGERVAVKVQRPGIDRIIEADLEALRYIVGWLDRHTPVRRRVNLPLVLREFEDTLRLELDYHAEAHHAERLSVLLHDSTDVIIPRVYWSHTRGRVLTLQFMVGIKISDFQALDDAGIDRSQVAEILLRAYLRQIVEVGFFHADPHPGNLFVRPGPRIVLLDFGMVGDISPPMRENLRKLFLGVVHRDYDEILDALDRLGFIPVSADLIVLRRAVAWTMETFYEMSFAELQAVRPEMVLDRLQDVFYTESVRIPANYAFLGRALGTLSGLCTALDPSFQFVTVAEPFARGILQRRQGPVGVAEVALAEARSLARTTYSIPYLTRSVLERIHNGELDFHHELTEVTRALDRVERAMRRLLFGMLLAAFLVAGAFIFPTHLRAFSVGAFVVALIMLIGVLSPFRRSSR